MEQNSFLAKGVLLAYPVDTRIVRCKMKLKIYTKTGDLGKTSLYGGKRVWKNDLAVEAYGEVDELNSAIGLIRAEKENKFLEEIQRDLLMIGSSLAGYPTSPPIRRVRWASKIKNLERRIDEIEERLPELKNFIFPSGLFHLARSVCRRAERRVVELSQKKEIDKSIIVYLNRLSDLLFEMARDENRKKGKKEVVWNLKT